MFKYLLSSFLFCFFVFCQNLNAQDKSVIDNYEKKYQSRIKKSYLYRVYIPKDLNDVFSELNKKISKDSKSKFKTSNEEVAVKKLHFSLGRWMVYNWQFYEGSRLSHFLKGLGIYNPDDMASFLIRTYHRSLNQRPLEVKTQVLAIQAMRKKIFEKEMSSKKVLKSEVRKRSN